ncbi:nicotinate-nucleotide adenylyltransferase [Aquimarina pacifica]|uniref:nicotinate-nucleotide adenylyltransferase n=1 Tax=Aquimarina pacifica TaxID=1296415 RepID=UPI0004714353|nr:nicotinate-nucleotide adenylyltransferase [Aquimarina pacifica]
MRNVLICILILGLTSSLFTQKTEQLSEVFISAINYKYLSEVDSEEVSVPLELIKRQVATFNLKEADFYQDDYDLYHVTFFIPEGKILAAYDKEGNVIRTAERYKGGNLPAAIYAAIVKRFPGWAISKNIYIVNYNDQAGAAKTYKLKLENGDKTIRVKMNEHGAFL